MERRLLKAIIKSSDDCDLGAGLWLAYRGGWFAAHWLHLKLALVLGMSGVHGILSKYVANSPPTNGGIREILPDSQRGTTVLMILIVILAVVKPF